MGPSRAKGRIVVGGVVKKLLPKMMRPVFQQVEVVLQINSPSTSTPSKPLRASVSCLKVMERRGMWLPSFQLYQPNKVKSGQYQQNNTYNKLIEPDNATSAATSMTSLLNLLTTKNIKQKLGKTAQSQENSGGVSKTPSALLFLIHRIIQIQVVHQDPLKRLIQWKKVKLQQ